MKKEELPVPKFVELSEHDSFSDLLAASWALFEGDIEANEQTGKGVLESKRPRYIETETAWEMFNITKDREGEDLNSIHNTFDSLKEIYDYGSNLPPKLKHGIVRTLASTSVQAFRKTKETNEKIAWAETAYFWFGKYRTTQYHEYPREKLYMALELAETRQDHAALIDNEEQKKQLLRDGFRDLRAIQADIPVDEKSQFKFHVQLKYLANNLRTSINDPVNEREWLQWLHEEAEAVMVLLDPSKEGAELRNDYRVSASAAIALAKVTHNHLEKKSYFLLADKRYTEIIALNEHPTISEYIDDEKKTIYILTKLAELTDEPKEKTQLLNRLIKEQISYGCFMQKLALTQTGNKKQDSLDTSATTFFIAGQHLLKIPLKELDDRDFTYEYELLIEAGSTAEENNHIQHAINIYIAASILTSNFIKEDMSKEEKIYLQNACYESQIKSAEYAEKYKKTEYAASMFVRALKTAEIIAEQPGIDSIFWYKRASNIAEKTASLLVEINELSKASSYHNRAIKIRKKIEKLNKTQKNE